MDDILKLWPVISGIASALIVAVVWMVTVRVRTDARLTTIEEKVKVLFDLWNNRSNKR
jgi:hypothetical protein